MENSFESLFDNFFANICKFNTQTLSRGIPNEDYIKTKKCLGALIPIYNRIMSENDLSIENVLTETIERPAIENTIENVIDNTIENTKPMEIIQVDEIDEQGDQLVNDLNLRSSIALHEYISTNWTFTEEIGQPEKDKSFDTEDDIYEEIDLNENYWEELCRGIPAY